MTRWKHEASPVAPLEHSDAAGGAGALQPDPTAPPPAGPPAQHGVPWSEELRQHAAELMYAGIDWMEEHRSAARWAGLAIATGSVAFLLRYNHLPGWYRYTSMSELPPRLLGPHARRVPVVLHSVARRGDALAADVAHYPLLRRLVDAYRGIPPSAAARRAAEHGQLMTCHLAGPIQPTQEGLQYLRSLPRSSVSRLRLLSIVPAQDQAWTTAAPSGAASAATTGTAVGEKADAQRARQMLQADGSSAMPTGSDGTGSSGSSSRLQVAPSARHSGVEQGAHHEPAGSSTSLSAMPLHAFTAQRQAQQAGHAQQHAMLLWGELYSREQRRGLAALLPRRRANVGERLIARGEAALMDAIDLEWLGVSWARIDLLCAAEQAAIQQGLGMWARRAPSLAEWSSSVARSAWARMHRAARISASATTERARSLGGTGAAAASNAAAAAAAVVARGTSSGSGSGMTVSQHSGSGAGEPRQGKLGHAGWWGRLSIASRAMFRRSGKRRTGTPAPPQG